MISLTIGQSTEWFNPLEITRVKPNSKGGSMVEFRSPIVKSYQKNFPLEAETYKEIYGRSIACKEKPSEVVSKIEDQLLHYRGPFVFLKSLENKNDAWAACFPEKPKEGEK